MQRMTRQRSAVSDALAGLEDFRSAQQLHELLREHGNSVGLATVYRTLQSLAEDGDVDVLHTPEGEAVYRRCTQSGHHHHLVCRSCGRTVEIEGPGVEAWADEVGAAQDFTAIKHTVELTGICSDCPRSER